MRRLFTTEEARAKGLTEAALRWGEARGRWRRVERGVYGLGPEDPTDLDRARPAVLATGGVASGRLAAVLHGLDGVELRGLDITTPRSGNARRAGVRRRDLDGRHVVHVGRVPCTDGLQTLVDLASADGVDDLVWEQALESALRERLVSIDELAAAAPRPRAARARIRRVLALRPKGAKPTESFLETRMVQLARTIEGLPPPVRQLDIFDDHGRFVARVDLAWPELGIFIELDGEHHKGQPVYDASRETAVVAATGWLCGRFTWTEVTRYERSTARRLAAIAAHGRVRV